ncbi:MAG TPA: DUF6265 family protein [Cyclobacteriaceae bacterium]
MKLTLCVLLCTLMFLFACAGKVKTKHDLSQVDWLIGYWQRPNARESVTAHERWEKTSATELTGWGVAMRNGDTTFVEKLQIILRNDTLYYVADVVENPAPVYFQFTSITVDGFVSENAAHDFPKKIQYQLVNDTLTAITSGDKRELTFKFIKSMP